VQHNGYVTAQPLAPARPSEITKHPVYREIRRKARQAKSWPKHLRARPIVLVICTPGSGREFWSGYDVEDYSVRRAVFSALLDHERMTDLERINILRQRLKLHPKRTYVESNRLRVAGSGLISAVLTVRIEQDHDWLVQRRRSKAKPELFFNYHARHPLPDRLAAEIQQLDFNAIEYGPGWESWQNTDRQSLKARNLRRGGPLEMRFRKEGELEVRIPTIKVLKIMSGEATAQEVFAEYGNEPPNPLNVFEQALASELTLESMEIINGDPTTRAEQQIAFRFSEGRPAVIARARAQESST
jgi:hypothetical protein